MYIEITQDSAGILLINNHDQKDCIYTKNVETCQVYAFYGNEAAALIHDSGQLSIESIVRTVKQCGKIAEVYIGVSTGYYDSLPEVIRNHNVKMHRKREREIIKRISYKSKVKTVHLPYQSLILKMDCVDNSIVNLRDNESIAPPDRAVRDLINKANNLFSEKNSQSIPIDLQYDGQGYTQSPKFIKTKNEMEKRAISERMNGDGDYQWMLNNLISLGII